METQYKEIAMDDMNWLCNREFIEKSVGWCNHGDDMTRFTSEKIHKWVYYDSHTDEIKEFEFNNVIAFGMHGFGGTQYTFSFKLNDKYVAGVDFNTFAPTVEQLKEKLLKDYNEQIEWLDGLKTTYLTKIEFLTKL